MYNKFFTCIYIIHNRIYKIYYHIFFVFGNSMSYIGKNIDKCINQLRFYISNLRLILFIKLLLFKIVFFLQPSFPVLNFLSTRLQALVISFILHYFYELFSFTMCLGDYLLAFTSCIVKNLLCLQSQIFLCCCILITICKLLNNLCAQTAYKSVRIRWIRIHDIRGNYILFDTVYLVNYLLVGINNIIIGILYNYTVILQQIRQLSRHLRLLQLQSRRHPQAF